MPTIFTNYEFEFLVVSQTESFLSLAKQTRKLILFLKYHNYIKSNTSMLEGTKSDSPLILPILLDVVEMSSPFQQYLTAPIH